MDEEQESEELARTAGITPVISGSAKLTLRSDRVDNGEVEGEAKRESTGNAGITAAGSGSPRVPLGGASEEDAERVRARAVVFSRDLRSRGLGEILTLVFGTALF